MPPPTRTTFGPERFALTIIDPQHGEVTCPAGQTTRQRSRTRQDTGNRYQFKTSQCADYPMRHECLASPAKRRGRVVVKNEYETEYPKVHEKARTPQYEETRRTHPKIERKLGEMVRHHRARRASFRGIAKVLLQGVLTALVVNAKRMVKLLRQKTAVAIAALKGRAAPEMTCEKPDEGPAQAPRRHFATLRLLINGLVWPHPNPSPKRGNWYLAVF